MTKGVRWTAMEDNVLFNQGAILSTKALEALLPGRSESSIRGRLNTLKIKKETSSEHCYWSQAEDDLLRDWFKKIGASKVRDRYLSHRPLASIYSRAKLLGLSGRSVNMDPDDLELIGTLFIETDLTITSIAEKFELAIPWCQKICWSELEMRYLSKSITEERYLRTKVLRASRSADRTEALDKLLNNVKAKCYGLEAATC